jgi:hypothetical protein
MARFASVQQNFAHSSIYLSIYLSIFIYVYLLGWFDSLSDKPLVLSESDATDGTTRIRFNANRKCALQTAINYWNEKRQSTHDNDDDNDNDNDDDHGDDSEFNGHVVYAGLEPVEFTNLFPFWKVNENARNCNLNVKEKIFLFFFFFWFTLNRE